MVKAVFLDRDGVINVDYGYVYQQERFVFIDGIFDFCKVACDLGYLLIVITNQSGIARGYYSHDDFFNITQYMKEVFMQHNIALTDVFYCPDLSGFNRKPNEGLFLLAKEKYGLNMAQSVCIGDNERDIIAGIRAGCGKTFLFNHNFDEIIQNLTAICDA